MNRLNAIGESLHAGVPRRRGDEPRMSSYLPISPERSPQARG